MRTPRERAFPFHGTGAEFLAGQYFSDRGYRILERNYRGKRGEIDLIVERENEVVFVEVRYRSSSTFGRPVETVTHAKRCKLSLTALQFIDEHGIEGKSLRFDVLAVMPTKSGLDMEHFENAFEPDLSMALAFWE